MKVVYLFLFALLVGCNSGNRTLKREINNTLGRTINWENGLEFRGNNYEKGKEFFDSAQFIILNYIDTSGCEECKLHLFDWGRLQRDLDTLNSNVKICFVVNSNNIENIERLCRIHRFSNPILYDSVGVFIKGNRIPKVSGFQTLLLDSSNKVIGVGSPLYNGELRRLYYELFQTYYNK